MAAFKKNISGIQPFFPKGLASEDTIFCIWAHTILLHMHYNNWFLHQKYSVLQKTYEGFLPACCLLPQEGNGETLLFLRYCHSGLPWPPAAANAPASNSSSCHKLPLRWMMQLTSCCTVWHTPFFILPAAGIAPWRGMSHSNTCGCFGVSQAWNTILRGCWPW